MNHEEEQAQVWNSILFWNTAISIVKQINVKIYIRLILYKNFIPILNMENLFSPKYVTFHIKKTLHNNETSIKILK
jgi:hypothetical protein